MSDCPSVAERQVRHPEDLLQEQLYNLLHFYHASQATHTATPTTSTVVTKTNSHWITSKSPTEEIDGACQEDIQPASAIPLYYLGDVASEESEYKAEPELLERLDQTQHGHDSGRIQEATEQQRMADPQRWSQHHLHHDYHSQHQQHRQQQFPQHRQQPLQAIPTGQPPSSLTDKYACELSQTFAPPLASTSLGYYDDKQHLDQLQLKPPAIHVSANVTNSPHVPKLPMYRHSEIMDELTRSSHAKKHVHTAASQPASTRKASLTRDTATADLSYRHAVVLPISVSVTRQSIADQRENAVQLAARYSDTATLRLADLIGQSHPTLASTSSLSRQPERDAQRIANSTERRTTHPTSAMTRDRPANGRHQKSARRQRRLSAVSGVLLVRKLS